MPAPCQARPGFEYRFDRVYRLSKIWLWNGNQSWSDLYNRGLRNVIIQYSADTNVWSTLGTYEIPRCPGTPNEPYTLEVDFAGALAQGRRYHRLDQQRHVGR